MDEQTDQLAQPTAAPQLSWWQIRTIPVLIAIFIGIVGEVALFIAIGMPSVRLYLTGFFSTSSLTPVLSLVAVLGLAGLFGYWQMRKWGVYVYALATIIFIGYGFYIGIAGKWSYALPVVVLAAGLAYLRKMT